MRGGGGDAKIARCAARRGLDRSHGRGSAFGGEVEPIVPPTARLPAETGRVEAVVAAATPPDLAWPFGEAKGSGLSC